jgi:C4-dicarboxylate transporter, DctM subunit
VAHDSEKEREAAPSAKEVDASDTKTKVSAAAELPNEVKAPTSKGATSETRSKKERRPTAGPEVPAWSAPVARVDDFLTRIERNLLLVAVGLEVLALSVWVLLRAMVARPGDSAIALRVALLTGLGALVIWLLARKQVARKQIGLGGFALSFILAFATRNHFSSYFENILTWMENASVLLMIGGLRGVATRLTLWVALLGASTATGKGKHITIDIALRYAPVKARMPMALMAWLVTCVVCFAGTWGFIDHIAVAEYSSEKDVPASKKVSAIVTGVGNDWFLARKQAALDFKTLPHVARGEAYNKWFMPQEWNAWVQNAGFEAHYPADEVLKIKANPDATEPRQPTIEVPGNSERVANLLSRSTNLIVPFGLLMIGLRFVLRLLLAIAGRVSLDPDSAHAPDDEEGAHSVASAHGVSAPHKGWVVAAVIAVVLLAVAGLMGPMAAFVGALAALGAPLFALMGGSAELAWLTHGDTSKHALRFIAPNVLDDRFAGSPILVTIPLFTLVGYVLAKSKSAERIVRVSTAMLGWMPGGLGVVCVLACAVFTLLTGGSGVTIIAIGGLLLPAIRKRGYREDFSLGLLTSGGSLGLLLPFSLPLLVYALVAGVDLQAANQAVIGPGVVVLAFFAAYSIYSSLKSNMPWGMEVWLEACDGTDERAVALRQAYADRPNPLLAMNRITWNFLTALWDIKWELLLPVIIGTGVAYFGIAIEEIAGLIALYAIAVEAFVYEDISVKRDLPKVIQSALTMAGAIIIILTMANALVNYVIDARIPETVFARLVQLGISERWQFLLLMNVFLLVLGMLMEGFSAIFVAVPLILPFAARFHLGPFHVGMIFLLNLELAYCMPPLGLNLFIAGFRFGKPATALYRPILPFLGILFAALMLISYVPKISNVMVEPQIAAERAKAKAKGEAPREAWLLECIQEDRLNPLPCTEADRQAFPNGKMPESVQTAEIPKAVPTAGGSAGSPDDDLLKDLLGDSKKDAGSSADSASKPQSDDDLLKDLLGEPSSTAGAKATAAPSSSAPPNSKPQSDDDLLKDLLK